MDIWSARDGKRIRKSFASKAEAVSWRAEAKRAIDRGTMRAPSATTLRQAAEEWLAAAEAGEVRNRQGKLYKPATLRGYRQALRDHVLPALGNRKLSAISRPDLQTLIGRWLGAGLAPGTVRNALKPIQGICRRAEELGELSVNPTSGLRLPAPDAERVEIVSPYTAASLLLALPRRDQALWATAIYAGLRYGELRALRWQAVDLGGRRIEVCESWDPKAGSIEPKSRAARRTVPMPAALHELLLDHRLARADAPPEALVFGRPQGDPFHATSLYRRADRTWREAGLSERLRLHQARHTYASFMIAAGVNAKALSAYMGHSTINVTFDLYGHLMPGSEAEAAGLLDAFLARADEQGRSAASTGYA